MEDFDYPKVLDPKLVGTYPASAKAGGGYVWDAVLEYRVWCHPERGAPDLDDGSDYFYPFESFQEAFEFSQQTEGAEEPMALVLQKEYISEPEPGHFIHVRERRITEWQVVWLKRPRRTPQTIPAFFLRMLQPTGWTYFVASRQQMPNNSVNRTQIPLRGLCAGYLGRWAAS